ncbi:MAG: hypothetical protein M3Z24_01295 [Chloroflexota bacterium]|nr:hypothetical protein [Chloroflexota bacterium]
MRFKFLQHLKTNFSVSLSVKCGAIFLLFVLSVLIVACGGSANSTDLGNPPVTVTIDLGNSGSPPPTPIPYSCNTWITNETPGPGVSTIGVYAKFTHLVDGNPQGVGGASGVATVQWPDGNPDMVKATTTNDGLAVFSVSTANRAADLNKLVRVVVSFTGGPQDTPPCQDDGNQAGYFTLVATTYQGTVTVTVVVTGTGTPNGTPSAVPSATSTVDPTPTPKHCPSPKPGKTPPPCHP